MALSAALVAAAVLVPAAAADARTSPFVQRDGSRLTLDGKPFRFAGPNEYWLGLDENVGGVDPSAKGEVDYPTYFRIRDGLITAKAMGSTVVRAHTLGVSVGNPESIEPELGKFDPAAFAPIDYAIAEAHRLGLRLMIPLTDNWQYYSGGRFTYLDWLGLSTANDGALFYTDPRARAAYQEFVKVVLLHRNPLTGLRLIDDPTIMAWELGNELNSTTPEWVQDNAAYIKRLAPNQLVAAGKQFGLDPNVLASSAVDISDSHYYPPTAAGITADAKKVTDSGKVYVAGEFASSSASSALLDAVAADPNVSGANFWSLFPDADHYSYVQHADGFTVHYPGDTPAMKGEITALVRFAEQMTGSPAPHITGDAPLITGVDKQEGLNTIAWRNTAGAYGYQVQRRSGRGGWTTISGREPINGSATPWLDQSPTPGLVDYRVRALDEQGNVVKTSSAVTVAPSDRLRVDPLEDWFVSTSHTSSLRRVPTSTGVEILPEPRTSGAISYTTQGLRSATFSVQSAGRPRPEVEVTTDGTSWKPVPTTVTKSSPQGWTIDVEGSAAVRGVRLDWTSKDRYALRRVAISDSATSVPTAKPSAFTISSPTSGTTGASTLSPISWTESKDAAYYRVTVSTHADFSDPLVDASVLTGTSYSPTTPWPGDTTLHVRVDAVNGLGSTGADPDDLAFSTRAAANGVLVDDFDGYTDDAALQAAWKPNTGGDPITATLGAPGVGSGHSMVLTFSSGPNYYNGVIHALTTPQDWSGSSGLQFWAKPSVTGQQINVQFTANGSFWEKKVTLNGADGQEVTIPFSEFAPPSWADQGASLDLSSVTAVALYPALQGSNGSLAIDSIIAAK